ncbi:hypothetical protein Rs2_32681 [Raphanus sativus]|nr:hypothetical protein Rs2_32681 [Raphanus sativus]
MNHSTRFLSLFSPPILRALFIGPLTKLRRLHGRSPLSFPLQRFHTSAPSSGFENEFFPGLPEELLRQGIACLPLARDRPELLEMVSRRDVQVVVENVKPLLFRIVPDSLERMSLYLTSVGPQGIGKCDEARPKRQLTDSEWECPQCDFYNCGRNIACLRCDCKRPGDFSLTSADSSHSRDDPELERRVVENVEKAQRLANAENSVASDGNSNRSLNEILGSTSSSLPSSSRRFESSQVVNSDFVPFVPVPLPSDMFAKKADKEDTQIRNASQVVQKEPSSNNPEPGKVRNGKSLEGSLVKELDMLDMSEEAKAERCFKRVAEIKNISELSHIPDEDFPSIMPMRRGVNRFVVSKRKTPLQPRLASQRQHRDPLPFTYSNPASNRDT